ncbi:hypothetical protein BU23DRAFT_651298 [Bimuria novae-zelandiae CBS 107.79]|uniref:Uncharacterized protein n=1 Tax=Bimuria novae-zelandiae CBS 107.79 TaxID=1447943 RepID=A0A6A5VL97_9PLEO|nr:hypothetical protein BU23DRAFT_651298 [Bimuria novae-zelandiae CBS 107.79]
MSAIPYDLLPMCEPEFAHMKLKQKQSFITRFFGIRAGNKKEDSVDTAREFSSAPSSINSSYVSLNSKASTGSMRLPASTPPRRPRASTANSSTSIASFVSQSSVHSNASYRRVPSRSPSRERTALLDDGWTPVEEYL